MDGPAAFPGPGTCDESHYVEKRLLTHRELADAIAVGQFTPGPVFSSATFIGWQIGGPVGAVAATIGIFLPSFLLVIGALPFWDLLRSVRIFQSALKGINAAVVGLLLAALYNPVWTSAIYSPADFALGLIAFGLLMFWKYPPWLVVILTAAGGELTARI